MQLFPIISLAAIGFLLVPCASQARGGGSSASSSSYRTTDRAVSGYTRQDGTYVAPYHATNPNETQRDNYSTKGNVNPYTGMAGLIPATR